MDKLGAARDLSGTTSEVSGMEPKESAQEARLGCGVRRPTFFFLFSAVHGYGLQKQPSWG